MPGIQELIVIAVVALLVLGPNRLPEVARNAARLLARLRVETQRSVSELKRAASVDGLDRDVQELRRELRETRSAMGRSLSVDGPAASPSSSAGRSEGPAASGAARPQDRPPPFDPEAT